MLRVIVLTLVLSYIATVVGEPQVPCYFIFGDSLSDVGNNNDLATRSKANFPPYGVDFPGGVPTGRFSNGRNFVDRLTELLGFDEYIAPYSTATRQQILKGVNYASGGAGIRSETGQHFGHVISMDQQLLNHVVTITKWSLMTRGSVQEKLNKCLYTVNMGNNDYINNYFMPEHYVSSKLYNPTKFADLLINQFSRQLKTLYSYGARKVAVFGVGLLGCTLAEISKFGTNGSLCVDKINEATHLFNQRLISAVDRINADLPGAQFTYISSESSDTGSTIANATCCQVDNVDYSCKEFTQPCKERTNYFFWDGFHPTEIINVVIGEQAYKAADPSAVHPVDIATLVSSDRAPVPKAARGGYPHGLISSA